MMEPNDPSKGISMFIDAAKLRTFKLRLDHY